MVDCDENLLGAQWVSLIWPSIRLTCWTDKQLVMLSKWIPFYQHRIRSSRNRSLRKRSSRSVRGRTVVFTIQRVAFRVDRLDNTSFPWHIQISSAPRPSFRADLLCFSCSTTFFVPTNWLSPLSWSPARLPFRCSSKCYLHPSVNHSHSDANPLRDALSSSGTFVFPEKLYSFSSSSMCLQVLMYGFAQIRRPRSVLFIHHSPASIVVPSFCWFRSSCPVMFSITLLMAVFLVFQLSSTGTSFRCTYLFSDFSLLNPLDIQPWLAAVPIVVHNAEFWTHLNHDLIVVRVSFPIRPDVWVMPTNSQSKRGRSVYLSDLVSSRCIYEFWRTSEEDCFFVTLWCRWFSGNPSIWPPSRKQLIFNTIQKKYNTWRKE